MSHKAVWSGQVVGVDTEGIAGIGPGVGDIGKAGVLSDHGTPVVPEIRATERIEEADRSAARRVVASAGDGIAGVAAHETTSIRRVTAFRATCWFVARVQERVGIEDPFEKISVELIDHAVDVEIGAKILGGLFAIELEDHQVGRVQQSVAVEVASALAAGNPADRGRRRAILLRGDGSITTQGGEKQQRRKSHRSDGGEYDVGTSSQWGTSLGHRPWRSLQGVK